MDISLVSFHADSVLAMATQAHSGPGRLVAHNAQAQFR